MRRFIISALLSCLLALGLGGLAHSQDGSPYARAFQAKQIIGFVKQGFENEDPDAHRPKNDLGIIFDYKGIFDSNEKLTIKVTEDDGTLIAEQTLKKKEMIVKTGSNPKTGEVYSNVKPLFIELPKGKRILKGLTVEFPELGYSQHFDQVPEAAPFVRTNT
jgi:hypothetical protein